MRKCALRKAYQYRVAWLELKISRLKGEMKARAIAELKTLREDKVDDERTGKAEQDHQEPGLETRP